MTVREFTNRLWYVTPFVVISEKTDFGDLYTLESIKEKALWCGTGNTTMSESFKAVAKREVKRYGIFDNELILEV